jgi:hypothetical protein
MPVPLGLVLAGFLAAFTGIVWRREAARSGIDLYLGGHTHSGQIQLPVYGALVTFSMYGKLYEAGEYQVENTLAYISRGIGMEGFGLPRARFLCPPEVIIFEIGSPQP